jgi:crotonobetainyl-CoA:carnitine CoA-transferase CaiB-like acyl-CoA transferase
MADGPTFPTTLSGLRVLDLTRNFAGPYCTMTLGDLGADVVKVESPGVGDDTRSWAPPTWHGISTSYLAANRNKRSIAVDLDHPDGAALVRELAAQADVVVESFRPGSLDKRGLGSATLRAANPRLITCSISAFGSDGPMRDEPGYDPVLQAYTGIMAMTGEPDRAPVRVGIAAIDLGAAVWATVAILGALANRERTGTGAHIETSLFEIATWWLGYPLVGYLGTGVVPSRQGTTTAMIAPYERYATADEPGIMVAAANDNLFRSFAVALGLDALLDDERFTTNASRVKYRDELRGAIAPRLRERPAREWEIILREHRVPCSRVRTIDELVTDEQLAALGLLEDCPHPVIDDLRIVGVPVRVDGERGRARRGPPALGEHTDAVLAELGRTAEVIAELRGRGVVA